MASLGGDYDQEALETNAFGNQSFFQSSDLRYSLGNIKIVSCQCHLVYLVVLIMEEFGLDYETSNKWHQSVGGGLLTA
jgi:hypothetical protein